MRICKAARLRGGLNFCLVLLRCAPLDPMIPAKKKPSYAEFAGATEVALQGMMPGMPVKTRAYLPASPSHFKRFPSPPQISPLERFFIGTKQQEPLVANLKKRETSSMLRVPSGPYREEATRPCCLRLPLQSSPASAFLLPPLLATTELLGKARFSSIATFAQEFVR